MSRKIRDILGREPQIFGPAGVIQQRDGSNTNDHPIPTHDNVHMTSDSQLRLTGFGMSNDNIHAQDTDDLSIPALKKLKTMNEHLNASTFDNDIVLLDEQFKLMEQQIMMRRRRVEQLTTHYETTKSELEHLETLLQQRRAKIGQLLLNFEEK